jgi:adenylate cyclase
MMQNANHLEAKYSERFLYELLQKRLEPHADKAEIDAQIWEQFGEVWCMMFTDLVGFSRLVAKFGIIHFLQTIYESERLFSPLLTQYNGYLLKTEGDSMMALFKHADQALTCAIEMQLLTKEYNLTKSDEEKVLICIGLGFGKMLRVGDADVYGKEVNAACKLGEETAKQGDILVTQAVMQQSKNIPTENFKKLRDMPAWLGDAYHVLY